MEILYIITTLFTSLLAGIFLAFSVAVNGGLHKLDDSAYVRAMQSINKVILNPVFFTVFMAPLALLPLMAFLTFATDSLEFYLYVGASVLYIFGVFGITAGGNVPLNDKLAARHADSAGEAAAARKEFEQPWNRLHAARTFLAVVSVVLVLTAGVI